MKTCNIRIELELDIEDEPNDEAIKEAVYQYLLQLIDDESLDFEVES